MDAIRGDVDQLLRTRAVDDPQIIEAMVHLYRAPVYRLARSILNDEQDAEDSVQDAFVKAAFSLHRYQVGTNFKAWLFTIAVNTCRGYLRKRAARASMQRVLETIHSMTPVSHGVESTAERREAQVQLWDLVDRLGEKHRLVVILRLAHDLPVHEISQILDVKEKTVYTRLYDAFGKLRRMIEEQPESQHLRHELLT